ncbi:hypothetical protein [Paenibacillus xylaniclasticus]|uniref:hypothetical protein n=1 Tax=Paenibacillus xylaniclasticus TaxID=588083 RepID=UPI000FDBE871|nr:MULTISPECIES: hypothetical protein [Paenibacillus]GFN32650.1 hypothetical protein PCURB6_29100 [Paenibacillus curdlanolyticus]
MSTVDVLLAELREVTQAAFKIDLNEEANLGLLLSLQDRQIEIQTQIDEILSNSPMTYTTEQLAILQECLQLEQQGMVRKMQFQAELGAKLSSLTAGKKSKQAYQAEQIQQFGYFIDKQQ